MSSDPTPELVLREHSERVVATQVRGVGAADRVVADVGESWEAVCAPEHLTPYRGVAALVNGTEVAVFLLADGELRAVDNLDPFSGASVLSRGIVGEVAGVPTVASPIYKQRFDLRTGACLDDLTVRLRTWAVRLGVESIEVALP